MGETIEDTELDTSPISGAKVIPGNFREFSQSATGNSQTSFRKWAYSLSSREIAEFLKTDRRNITNWYAVVRRAYSWLAESELRTGTGKATRYTPFCCEQFESLKFATAQGKSYDDWVLLVHEAFPNEIASWLQSQSAQQKNGFPIGEKPIPLQVEVMGVDGLSAQQQAQHQALSLRQQATDALNAANQSRLAQLREFFADQRSQHQIDRTQRRAQLEAEAQDEAIEEFLIKQEAKNAVLSQLEQLNALGKLSIAEIGNVSSG